MVQLDIDGGGYDSAAEALFGGSQATAAYYTSLTSKLSGYGAMAGDDKTSEEFAKEYDVAAKEAVDAFNDVVDSYVTLGILTATSIENHRKANANSVYNKPPPVYDGSNSMPSGGPVDVPVFTPPSSLGGDNEHLPDFWNEIMDHLEGFAWPNADTGKLRGAAGAWRSAAGGLDSVKNYADRAVGLFYGQKSPEIPVATEALNEFKTQIGDLATELRSIAQACDDYAKQVEDTRQVIKDIIRDMAIEAGVSIVAGAIVGFFTFGGGAAAGTAIAGWRIVSAARKVLKALRGLKAIAKAGAVAKLTAAAAKFKPLRAILGKFKNAKKIDNAADAADDPAKIAHRKKVADSINDPKKFDPNDLKGMSREELKEVLKDWPSKPSKNGDGMVYTDPVNKGRQIRIMDGYTGGNRPDPITHGPYVVVSQNGAKTKLPLEGNPTL